MELVNRMLVTDQEGNALNKDNQARVMRFALESVTLLLSPIVPHFAEELWESLGYESSVLLTSWPSYREEFLAEDDIVIVVQVNGKLRSRFNISNDSDENTIKEMALSDKRVKKFINNKSVKKVIIVKKKLVNIVV